MLLTSTEAYPSVSQQQCVGLNNRNEKREIDIRGEKSNNR